jgi:hypothetical protein
MQHPMREFAVVLPDDARQNDSARIADDRNGNHRD